MFKIKMLVGSVLFTSEEFATLDGVEWYKNKIQEQVDVDRIWIENDETGYFNG